MAIQFHHKFVYNHFVRNSTVSNTLDALGNGINRIFNYQTGLTRTLAALRYAPPEEVVGIITRLMNPKILPLFKEISYGHLSGSALPSVRGWDDELQVNNFTVGLPRNDFLALISFYLGSRIRQKVSDWQIRYDSDSGSALLNGQTTFAPDDEAALYEFAESVIPTLKDSLNNDLFGVFTSLYLLSGEKLKTFIAKRTTAQHQGLATLYQEFKDDIFQGKEFPDIIP